MNNLLIFFAIPFAVIVISIALQKILRCPYLVAGIILSIFLVIGFAIMDTTLLIAGIVYTIISFVTAYLTMLICRWSRENNNNNNLISTLNNNNNQFIARTSGNIDNNGFTAITNGDFNNRSGRCGCNRNKN